MMAREYYVPGTRWLFDIINTIPVERSRRDVGATRAAMRALDKGHVLGIFPEGRLARDRNIGHFQTGVAMLALKSGVSVYPPPSRARCARTECSMPFSSFSRPRRLWPAHPPANRRSFAPGNRRCDEPDRHRCRSHPRPDPLTVAQPSVQNPISISLLLKKSVVFRIIRPMASVTAIPGLR